MDVFKSTGEGTGRTTNPPTHILFSIPWFFLRSEKEAFPERYLKRKKKGSCGLEIANTRSRAVWMGAKSEAENMYETDFSMPYSLMH